VLRFIAALKAPQRNERACIEAGEAMYGAHDSYRDNCQLSAPEVNFWSKRSASAAGKRPLRCENHRRRHRRTVAVFGKTTALKEHIPQIAAEYSRRVGAMPDIFEGSSSGAIEFGARRYIFSANGWRLSKA